VKRAGHERSRALDIDIGQEKRELFAAVPRHQFARTATQALTNVTVVGQIKLVNPSRGDIVKGSDGLFRTRGGGAADADPAVGLIAGAIESSNVNSIVSMVDMINLARQFDMHMKMLQSVDGNAQRATQLLATGAA